jgi:hypothetical protein
LEPLELLVGRRYAPVGNAVPVVAAKRARSVFREGIAVSLAVSGTEKRGDDLEVPFLHPAGLAPEVGEPEVDVQLEELDARRSLSHRRRPYSCRRTT